MKTLIVPMMALFVATCATAAVGAEVKSGLQPGAFPGAFGVLDCSGPAKGETLCYRCKFGSRPVVTIFAREIDDNLTNLIKQVDGQIAKNKQIKAFFVLMTDDPKASQAKLAALAKKNGIKNVPLTAFDGVNGPATYELSDKANVTVMMWVENDVKVNHAFANGQLNKAAINTIVGDTKKILE